MQSRGVRRPSVCPSVRPSVCKLAPIATSTTEVAGSLPNLHTMVPRTARIQGVLKVKVKVKGHVIRTLFCLHENRFFYNKHDSIATKLAHDGPQMGLHPGCAQGQGQRSRDRDTCIFTKIASSCRQIAGLRPSLHTMVPLLWLDENRFFYHKHDSIATKLAHDGPQTGLHPGCVQGQGQGQRSRDTGTSVMSQNVC